MGLGFVILFWAVVGLVAAGVGSVIFGVAAGFLTRGVNQGRRRVITAASAFPVACLGWAAAIFVFQAIVNEGLLDRDLGIGDGWHCPLPNGYQVMFIDVTDQGWVYNPKTQGYDGAVVNRDDAIDGARLLQVTGPYIFAGVDSKAFDHLGSDSQAVDSYVALDTRIGKKRTVSTIDELRSIAVQNGTQVKLEPIYEVYSRYRFTWFDAFSGLLFFLPPLAGFIALLVWIIKLRARSQPTQQPA